MTRESETSKDVAVDQAAVENLLGSACHLGEDVAEIRRTAIECVLCDARTDGTSAETLNFGLTELLGHSDVAFWAGMEGQTGSEILRQAVERGRRGIYVATIGRRAQKAEERRRTWHKVKVSLRRQLALCDALPSALGAAAAALVALGAPVSPALLMAFTALAGAMIASYGRTLRHESESSRPELAWACADRAAEAYQGILARGAAGEDASRLLLASDIVEAAARFGIPGELAAALLESAQISAGRA